MRNGGMADWMEGWKEGVKEGWKEVGEREVLMDGGSRQGMDRGREGESDRLTNGWLNGRVGEWSERGMERMMGEGRDG